MAEEPDRIRDDIEVTRAQLAADVDRLADKTSPSRVAQRGWSTAKAKVRDVSDRVMGTAHDGGSTVKDKTGSAVDTVKDKAGSAADTVKDKAGSAADTVKDKAGSAADTVRDKAGDVADTVRATPAKVSRQTQGNPIAAGLIAFGAGLLAASLLPTTELEKRAGREVRDHAEDLIEPVREPLTQAAQGLKDDLGGTARDAVASVRDTAKDAVQTTKESAKSSAQDATAQVKENAKSVSSSS